MTHRITLLVLPDKTGTTAGLGTLSQISHAESLPLAPMGAAQSILDTPSAVRYRAASAEAQEAGGYQAIDDDLSQGRDRDW